jgi:hypothetical protein
LQRDQGFVIVLSGQRSQLGSTPQLEWSNWRNISFGIPRASDDFIATTIDKGHFRHITAKVSPTVRALLQDLAGEW